MLVKRTRSFISSRCTIFLLIFIYYGVCLCVCVCVCMHAWLCEIILKISVLFQWLSSNANKKVEKIVLANGTGIVFEFVAHLIISDSNTPIFNADKSPGQLSNLNISSKVVYPDTSRMVVYDPRQKPGTLQCKVNFRWQFKCEKSVNSVYL